MLQSNERGQKSNVYRSVPASCTRKGQPHHSLLEQGKLSSQGFRPVSTSPYLSGTSKVLCGSSIPRIPSPATRGSSLPVAGLTRTSALSSFLLKCLLSWPPKSRSMSPPEPHCPCLPSEFSFIPLPFQPFTIPLAGAVPAWNYTPPGFLPQHQDSTVTKGAPCVPYKEDLP